MVLEPDRNENAFFYPQTPPLSQSSNSIESPSYDLLQTPERTLFGLGLGLASKWFEGVIKEGCEGEVQSENLAGGDWARCGSPPMTPVYPSLRPSDAIVETGKQQLPVLSACPSLSPSPAPYSPAAAPNHDFCDPRNLTFASQISVLSVDFPSLPTLCQGDDEDRKFTSGENIVKPEQENSFNFTTHSLTSFDAYSDIESDHDLVNHCVINIPPTENVAQFFGNKRQRTSSDVTVSLDYEHFSSEDEVDHFEVTEETVCLSSLPNLDSTIKTEKRSKKARRNAGADHEDSSDSMVQSRNYTVAMNTLSGAPSQGGSAECQQNSAAPSQTGSSENNGGAMNTGSDAGASGNTSVPVNRRGRKQSLTEDPSKTFICDLCNRRFRRQEHLKRHYRSLHTADKPFECHECGKKFSRSDNLSQHARTHGSGSIVLGVLEDGELSVDHNGSDPEVEAMGKLLFEAAAAVGGSDNSGSDSETRKKRKRSE